MSAFLECYIHIEHLPRVLASDGILCDRMSRQKTTSENDRKLPKSFGNMTAPDVLTDSLSNPSEDWNLGCKKKKNISKERADQKMIVVLVLLFWIKV